MIASIARIWAGACLVFSVATGTLHGGTLPRYDLRPGQVLTYEHEESYKGQQGGTYKSNWQLWVVGSNGDGRWQIVARTVMTMARGKSASARDEMVSLARFDLRPDGEIPFSPSQSSQIDPTQVFPRLPGDLSQADTGWRLRDDCDDTTISYKRLGAQDSADAETFGFSADRRSFVERIYQGNDHRTFHFDCKRGVVTRAEITRSYGSHRETTGTGTFELKSIAEMEPAKLETFREEMDRFFTSDQEYLALCRQASKSGDRALALLDQARKLLSDARAKVTLPEPIAALDERLKDHNEAAQEQAEDANRFAAVIGQPAAWEIKDFDGRTHTLDQYRGKVLVLDFWYRGCGWCMRAMPQVKRIASHYRGRPVAVFGMNNDQKEEDAKFVVKEMQIDYPVLRAHDLLDKFGVDTFPTLIIIDKKGNVADIHVGYSPQLFEEVTAAVNRLLAGK